MGEMLAHLKLTHDLDIYIKFIGFITRASSFARNKYLGL